MIARKYKNNSIFVLLLWVAITSFRKIRNKRDVKSHFEFSTATEFLIACIGSDSESVIIVIDITKP